MGAMNWCFARSKGEEAAESGGGGLWAPLSLQTSHHEVLGTNVISS